MVRGQARWANVGAQQMKGHQSVGLSPDEATEGF